MKIILLHGMAGLGELFMAIFAIFFIIWVGTLVLAIVHLVKANSGKPVNVALKVLSTIASVITALPFLGALYITFAGGGISSLLVGLLFVVPLVLNIIAFTKEGKNQAANSNVLDA